MSRPVKFESEGAYIEHFYSRMLNGDAEDLYSPELGETESLWCMQATAEEAEQYGDEGDFGIGWWLLFFEDNHGFVTHVGSFFDRETLAWHLAHHWDAEVAA